MMPGMTATPCTRRASGAAANWSAPRRQPRTKLGHCHRENGRLRSIEMLEWPVALGTSASPFGPAVYCDASSDRADLRQPVRIRRWPAALAELGAYAASSRDVGGGKASDQARCEGAKMLELRHRPNLLGVPGEGAGDDSHIVKKQVTITECGTHGDVVQFSR